MDRRRLMSDLQKPLELVTSGLVAWYDVGDESTIDADGTANSLVTNTFVAWTGNNNPAHIKNNAQKPTDYNCGYCRNKGEMQIYFGQTFTELFPDGVTVELIGTSNYGAWTGLTQGSIKNSVNSSVMPTWTIGYNAFNPSNRTFGHRVFLLDASGADIYYQGTYRKKVTLSDAMSVTCLGFGGEAIGNVRIYNRYLSSAEIDYNYKYFAKNNRVGDVAIDSSGNFVGW